MRMKKTLSAFLTIVISLSVLTGCGNIKTITDKIPDEATSNTSPSGFPEGFTAKKISSIDFGKAYSFGTGNGGMYYENENGKWGVVSADGKTDTGAIYTSCEPLGNYFQVKKIDATEYADITSINCTGVVDGNGNEIVPMKYATVSQLNERYIRVFEVTGQTENEDEVLIYSYEGLAPVFGLGDNVQAYYKGVWYIYDVTTGKRIKGVSGTRGYTTIARGNFVEYTTDDKQQVIVNDKGETLPEGADLFANGYYALVQDNEGGVYNSDNEKMFAYALDGYIPTNSTGDYICAVKTDEATNYVLMDYSGKIVSAEFVESPMVYGTFVYAGKQIYDFEGNVISAGSFTNVYYEEQFGNAWFLKSDEDYTLIKDDGTILYQGTADDTISVDATYHFSIKKSTDEGDYYYSIKDKDFTLEGNDIAPWLVQVKKANDTYDVVDVISGETIISGYTSYSCIEKPGEAIYVYARKGDSGYAFDIYAIKEFT